MFIGYIFRTEETNTLASITMAAIFLFFSNIVLPLESAPIYIQKIAHYNPFVISELLLKQSIFFQYTFSELQFSASILIEYLIGLWVLLLLIQYFYQRKIAR